ncbi:YtxH domain-containing protein [Flavobacterium sp.]|uniref:YtxH domain-containing protein n=1 Tax=Flavobacterium sp. TaxID=239 RepID=UPI0026261D87|nr:YtxH domain-containing protein [Flavobacterium sp.]
MNSSKVLLGILGGVAVGAIAGVLLAPASGKDTRKKLLKNGKGYIDDLKDKFEDLQNEVTEKYNGFLDDAKDMVAAKEKEIAKNLK